MNDLPSIRKPPQLSPLPVIAALGLLACAGCENQEPARRQPVRSAEMSPKPESKPNADKTSVHALTLRRLDGSEVVMSTFAGKVLLIVNTASECGYTPQYEGLQALHAKYEARGFLVLGFPSNDFGGQEPGSSSEIATFCKTRFGVTFPMFEKVKTTGSGRSELYTLLTNAQGEPKWNFHKYLIDKRGVPVKAWPSATTPEAPAIARAIEGLLAVP